MESSLILVRVANEIAAIDASAVQSVVEIDAITPVPQSPKHVAGLAALRSRAMVVIDCRRSLEIEDDDSDGAPADKRSAVVVEIDEFIYALLVDKIEGVVPFDGEAMALRTSLDPGWARMTSGMVETSAGPALLLEPAALIKGAGDAAPIQSDVFA